MRAIAAAGLLLFASCDGPSATAPDVPSAPSVRVQESVGGVAGYLPGEADWLAVSASATTLAGRDTEPPEEEVACRLVLGFESGELRVLALEDPIGRVTFEVTPTELAAVIEGERTVLIADAAELEECVSASATTRWPEDDALSATERVDTFRFCAGRGLVARERAAIMPAGTRRQSWRRD